MVDLFDAGGPSFSRGDRVASSLKRELSAILSREVKDPRLAGCSVTQVRMSGDLKVAWIALSVFPKENWEQAERALKKAAGFLRREVGKRLRLRQTPELRFERDEGVDKLLAMDRILKNLNAGSEDDRSDNSSDDSSDDSFEESDAEE